MGVVRNFLGWLLGGEQEVFTIPRPVPRPEWTSATTGQDVIVDAEGFLAVWRGTAEYFNVRTDGEHVELPMFDDGCSFCPVTAVRYFLDGGQFPTQGVMRAAEGFFDPAFARLVVMAQDNRCYRCGDEHAGVEYDIEQNHPEAVRLRHQMVKVVEELQRSTVAA